MAKIDSRAYYLKDTQALVNIFRQAILNIEDSDYTHAQRLAWAGLSNKDFDEKTTHIESLTLTDEDKKAWHRRFMQTQPFVAVDNDNGIKTPVGFIEFVTHQHHTGHKKQGHGYIDCLYVHPKWQKCGIASCLLIFILAKAQLMGCYKVWVHASKPAKPLFAKFGFDCLEVEQVQRQEQTLKRWLMYKTSAV